MRAQIRPVTADRVTRSRMMRPAKLLQMESSARARGIVFSLAVAVWMLAVTATFVNMVQSRLSDQGRGLRISSGA